MFSPVLQTGLNDALGVGDLLDEGCRRTWRKSPLNKERAESRSRALGQKKRDKVCARSPSNALQSPHDCTVSLHRMKVYLQHDSLHKTSAVALRGPSLSYLSSIILAPLMLGESAPPNFISGQCATLILCLVVYPVQKSEGSGGESAYFNVAIPKSLA